MKITNVKFSKPKYEGGAVKQFVSICLDDQLVIKSLKVVQAEDGKLFISFPNRKLENGNRRFSSYPIEEGFKAYITREILEKYNEFLKIEPLDVE